MTDHCQSCGAEVVWGTNVSTRKAMPVDAAPSPIGNVSRYDAARMVLGSLC